MGLDLRLMIEKLPPLKNRIAEWRTRRALTQRKVAAEMGIEHTTLGRLERGELPVTTEYLLTLARVLDCHPVELIIDASAVASDDTEAAVLQSLRGMTAEQRAAILLIMGRANT